MSYRKPPTFISNFEKKENYNLNRTVVRIYNLYYPDDHAWIEEDVFDIYGKKLDWCCSKHSKIGRAHV